MKKIYLILFLLLAFAVLTCTSGVASAATVEEGHIDSTDINADYEFLYGKLVSSTTTSSHEYESYGTVIVKESIE